MNTQRILDEMHRDIARGAVVGYGLSAWRHGEELFTLTAGLADRENNVPAARDTLYRIFSQTKPVTGVAAVMALERGLFTLQQPVSDFLPWFAEQVCTDKCRPVVNRMQIQHLLNMTAGLAYPGEADGAERGARDAVDALQARWQKGKRMGTVEFANSLGAAPLKWEPGTHWNYSFCADVMGAVIEVASGMSFGEFLRTNLFEPLEMHDTGFRVPPEKRARLAQGYFGRNKDGQPKLMPTIGEHLGLENYAPETAFESGGAGLVSTLDDYAHFTQMLLNGGVWKNRRILSPAGRRFLTAPQLSATQRTTYWEQERGINYANFLRLYPEGSIMPSFISPGSFSWGGMLSTNFIVDPAADLTIHFMTQIDNGFPLLCKYFNMIYAQLDV